VEVVLESTETAAWIQRVADENPTLGIIDVIARQLGRVEPVRSVEQIVEPLDSGDL